MAFVSDESNYILASFSQSAIRHVQVGDPVDMVFANVPGKTFSGEIFRVAPVSGQAQLAASGQLPSLTGAPVADRWAVIASLDDEAFARSLPQGAAGAMAVYTEKGRRFHVISKVAIRMNAWLGYLTSP